jgi:hypothetical protein
MSRLRAAAGGMAVLLLSACAVTPPSYDYAAFRQSRPQSILVLPPVNNSTAVEASHSLMAWATQPLAESGYYVLPVTLVDETFRQNGLGSPAEIADVPVHKLREIFGADAALYIQISQYGTFYRVIQSETVVSAEARLVDLRSGALLWSGRASASSAEQRGGSQGGPLGMLVEALVYQVLENISDTGHDIAGMTSTRLLRAGRPAGMLYGPRSPKYQQDGIPAP